VDVLILSVPLTERTRHLVDADFLKTMKDGALLVNVARGAVVNTEALLTQAESGRLLAALEVTGLEPLPREHPLWATPGVPISPYAGAFTTALLPRVKRMLAVQLNRFARGQPTHNAVRAVPAAG
jgi:phosphoglycerate dehydrogenase-like enzyme